MTTPMITDLSPDDIRAAVAAQYGQVATDPEGEFNFPVGRAFAEAIGYPAATLDRLPVEASRSFAGVTYLHDRTRLARGETVLDLGSGAGLDLLLAAAAVAPSGQVIGVDYAEEMVALARANAERAGAANVTVYRAPVEALPLPDESVTVVEANGVFNLSAAKERAVAEVYRVLRPGGRLVAAEIALQQEIAAAERASLRDWFR